MCTEFEEEEKKASEEHERSYSQPSSVQVKPINSLSAGLTLFFPPSIEHPCHEQEAEYPPDLT